MADNTAIEWADRTWNPLLGCERVSDGCTACYAINTATIRAGNPHPKVAAAFEGLTERRDGRLDWTGRINLLPDRLNQPLSWKKPAKVFVNSQSDLFHKDVPLSFIEQVFAVMARTPQHTYQLLTKRHARMSSILRKPTFRDSIAAIVGADIGWPLPNLWLGVSVEDQHWADVRIPALLDTPATVRWLSCEPLLGPVDLSKYLDRMEPAGTEWRADVGNIAWYRPSIGWTVVGGESGPKARPMHPQWARDLRDQCVTAGVPFFFKQWGQYRPGGDPAQPCSWITPDGTSEPGMAGTPHTTAMVRVGKKAAGRLLDGRTWDEYPAERAAVAS